MDSKLTNTKPNMHISVAQKKVVKRSGLSLLVFALLVIAFIALAREIRENETLGFDNVVLLSINGYSSPQADNWVVALTDLGGLYGVPIITIGLASLFWIKNKKSRVLKLLIGVGGAAVLSVVLKLVFERDRPELWERLVTENSFSFPSGHAMASSAIGASLVLALWNTKYRVLSIIISTTYVLLVAFSRLYLGVHFPTDILAGWLVSVSWVILVNYIFKRTNKDQKSKDNSK
ncbi:MAG: phosphatase PAP2 family protein [bacterium]|nr:phosphatase PAP2 family protein [bacterium]